jgi:hypothetical protein
MIVPKHIKLEGERWRYVPGFEGLYAVSDHGRIWSCPREVFYTRDGGYTAVRGGHLMKPGGKRKKYLSVNLMSEQGETAQIRVNRLVAMVFLPAPRKDRIIVMHKDDNSKNNHYKNLKWGTTKENMEDKVSKGRQARGSTNGRALLTEQDVIRIRRFAARNPSRSCVSTLAETYNISKPSVRCILSRITWQHI